MSAAMHYTATCHCRAVEIRVSADPVDAKICHCRNCQTLHGAPMQWASIFHKDDVEVVKGSEHLRFFNSTSNRYERNQYERELPCKVSCGKCGTLIADEGRRMWMAFPSLFGFTASNVPEAFKPTCHIFYGARVMDVNDGLPKWSGHKGKSERLD